MEVKDCAPKNNVKVLLRLIKVQLQINAEVAGLKFVQNVLWRYMRENVKTTRQDF
jgi:hypothetical protein